MAYTQTAASKPNGPGAFKGVNHLKLASFDIRRTHDFYIQIFHFTPLPQFNHYTPEHKLFAVMFEHTPSRMVVEIRYEPHQAEVQKGWDPITWGVGTRKDLEEWGRWLDANGVKRSEILTGIKAWVLVCEDPDGRHVRLYVEDEEHEWTDHPSKDQYWLRSMEADPKA